MDNRYIVFGSLFLISNRLQTVGDHFLKELTCKQWFLLTVLDTFFKEPPSIKELAAQMGCSHQNTKQIALKLQQKGFLDLQRDEKDQRAWRVWYTKKWTEYLAEQADRSGQFIDRLFSSLSGEETKALCTSLAKLHQALKGEEWNEQ